MRKMRCGWSSCWLPLLVWILVLTLLLAYFIQDIWREYVPLCTLLSWHKFFAKDVLGRFSQAAASWLLFSECQWNSILKFPPPIIARREEVNKKHPRHGLSRAMILGRWHLLRKWRPRPVGADQFTIIFWKQVDKVQSEIFYHSFFSLDSHFHSTSPMRFNHTVHFPALLPFDDCHTVFIWNQNMHLNSNFGF